LLQIDRKHCGTTLATEIKRTPNHNGGMGENLEHTSVMIRPDQKEFVQESDANVSKLTRDAIDELMD
jgi:hypothetical protein